MESKQIPTPDSDARQTPPSFDEMVEMIKKLFTDYLEDHVKSKPSEITKSWERYRALNHLWQDGQQPVPRWVKSSERLPGLKTPVKWRQGETEMKAKAVWYMILDTNSEYLSTCEWLDESGAAAAPQWTPASTKPEHNVGVLVFIPGEDNHITSGMWDISNQWVLLDEYRTPEEEVTHWMPLPAFPEGHERDVISDEWVSTLKAIAKEELSKKNESAAGREEEAVALAEWAVTFIRKWDIETGQIYLYDGSTFPASMLLEIFKQQKQKLT